MDRKANEAIEELMHWNNGKEKGSKCYDEVKETGSINTEEREKRKKEILVKEREYQNSQVH